MYLVEYIIKQNKTKQALFLNIFFFANILIKKMYTLKKLMLINTI